VTSIAFFIACKLHTVLSLAVVQVEFAQSAFTVAEADGSVSVCINISGAVLARMVTALLSTQDITTYTAQQKK